MVALVPPVSALGFASPALGPWFDDAQFALPAPEADLSVKLTGAFRWLPPASGFLSLLVNTGSQPPLLAGLRAANGTPAFTENSLVALFRLMPEVEDRLDALLSDFIDSVDGAATNDGVQRRARIRHLAIEIVDGANFSPPSWDVEPTAASHSANRAEQAEHLGLTLTGTRLENSERPMRDLTRPGQFDTMGLMGLDALLTVNGTAGDVFMWAFDDRGLAVDPGAVAAWWSALARIRFDDQFLWAPGLEGANRRTIADQQLASGRMVHLVNPHEGREVLLETEVTTTGLQGTGPLRKQEPFGAEVTVSLDSPDPTRPRRLAFLPNGTYAETATLWPAGTVFPNRDFVRVAMVDLDRHLVGAPIENVGDPAGLPGIRPAVRASEAAVLQNTIDAAAAAIRDALGDTGERHLVTPVLDADWGAFPVAPLPSVSDFPHQISALTVSALRGGGEAVGGTVDKQRVLVDLALTPDLAGAWVRAWPHGFDPETARHIRLNGGAAPVRGDGRVTLVAELPPGATANSTRMGMDFLVVTRLGTRLYPDVRFDRPLPVAGGPLTIDAATGPFTVCEMGVIAATTAGLTNPGQVPSGAQLVSRGAVPALVDPDSLRADHLTDETILSQLTAGMSVALTAPTYRQSPRGSSVARLSAGGASVDEVLRNGIDAVTEPGAALPGQERYDVAGGHVDGDTVRAALSSAPALSRLHESGLHQAGHPGVPATDETHGTGAALSGPAALPMIEYLRQRTARATLPDLFQAARALLPTLSDPDGPLRWTALLRTVSPGVEGELGLALVARTGLFPFGETLEDILDFLVAQGIALPAGVSALIPEATAVSRALDQRVFAASRGHRDGLRSVREALGRAEHFVYIETPAIDALEIGGEDVSPWSALLEKMQVNKGLRVLICHPIHLMPGTPSRLVHARNKLLTDLTLSDRIEFFAINTGPGRSLRLTSTTVVVDDAYAMTGNSHLWRRGLSFDSSLAVSMFHEQLDRGRPQEIRAFRRSLLAGRMGIDLAQLPEDPAELLLAIRRLRRRGGGHRLATELKEMPELSLTDNDINAWNRDGIPTDGLQGWLDEYLTLIQSGELDRFV